MRQYWRDFDSLERWARSLPHKAWWQEFLRDSGGTGFWHEALAVDDAGQLERITAPTLILWGDRDALFAGEDGQQRLAAAIPGAQLTVYRETGHSPNWERPERVAADLEGFVGRTPPGAQERGVR
jgi:pimeloyl-ACP methyl ester carboxylesterase